MAVENTPLAQTDAPAPEPEATEPDPFFNVPIGNALPDDEEIVSLVAKSVSLERAFSAVLSRDNEALDRKWQEFEAEAASLVSGLQLSGGDLVKVMGAAERKAEEKHTEYRKGVVTLSNENRQAQLKQLSAANEKAAALLRVFPSPVQLLSIYGLGEERRTHYAAQLANAGHSQLQTMARYALAKGDFALGAAVADRVAAMPKESRPFSAAKLAEAFVGKRHTALTNAARNITDTYQRVMAAEREHVSGRPNPRTKIANGLRTLQAQKGS